jgi:hypothetical protein
MRGRLVLVLAVALAACQSGGGSNGTPPIPIPPWGNFRHDISNSATNTSTTTGSLSIARNGFISGI